MADSRRIEWFLGRAGLLPPPQQIPSLVEPPAQDYEPFVKANRDAARELLVQQRMADPSYRAPSEQKRNLFRTKHQKEEAVNHANWTFTKHEVARAFNLLLSTEPLAAPGVAQALLLYTTLTSLDELWGHFHDPRLEKKMKKNRSSSSMADFFPPGITWLDKAASHDNINYIHLLCQTRVSQEALTRAFGISLSKSSADAMRLLLSYGAAASSYPDTVAQHIRIGDIALVSLLLSAPTAMTTGAWLECLEKDLARAIAGTGFSLEILLLCVANRRDLVCDSLLLAALRAQSIHALAVLLAYSSSNEKFFGVRESACELVTLVPDSAQRLSFFTLLAEAGLVGDYPVLREELVKSVKAHQIPLAKLLVGAGVSVDIPPHNALQWAISQMDFVMMELLKNGAFSSPVSLALSYVPESTSEPDMIHLMDIFGPMGVSGEHLDAYLIRAVRNKHLRLVEILVRCGASVEYEQASAIQSALEAVDFDMLKALLQRKCSPEILSAAIPAAMGILPRDSRLKAMKSILQKGVHSQVLGVPLQQVVAEDGDIDSDLIQLFLEYHAPVDLSNTADGNPVLVAARRGNVSVLQMLCTGGPRTETLSVAVPIAFKAMEKFGYDSALAMITLLLQKGANGKAVDQTLLEASSKDTRQDIVRVLVEHRANANYASGVAYTNAVERGNFELLKILCSGCPPSPQSLSVVFHTAMRPEYYNLKTIEFLLDSAPSSHLLQAPASMESVLRGHPNLAEVLPCLVLHGLSVDTGSGMLLYSAVQEKNIALLSTLVSSKPQTTSLAAAFQEATTVEPGDVRLEIMKLLLGAAASAEIGQSEYLPRETKAALSGDLAGLELLLNHKASVDVQGGRALQEAATEGAPDVLKTLLAAKPAALTVEKAFIVGSSSPVASHTKAVILGHLLRTDQVSVDAVSKALTEAVSKHPDDILLAKLLLSYHAKVEIDTLKMALESSPVDMFLSLSRTISEPAMAKELFRHVRNSEIDSEKRFIAYQSLVGKDIDADEVSEALLDSIKSDPDNLDTPNLLLENGAVVNYKDGAAFTMAFESSNLNLVRALSRHLVKADESAATVAFDYVSNNASFDSEVRLEIYSCLLEFTISKRSLNKALIGALESTATNTAIVSMLVEHGADPNTEEANCFVLACKKNSRDEFRALSKHADLDVVLPALLDHVKEELEVMNWLILLFEEQPADTKVETDELLFKCMRKFPQGTLVLGFLLDHGVPAAAKIIYNLRPMWEPEECTALMWAISSSLKIDNAVIIRLLQMEDAALPTYMTPQSQMSAVFLCLLDKSRTPVLKALLEQAPGDMFNSTVSGSDFSKIACYPKQPNAQFQSLFEEEDEISPREAALFLGNIDAFKLLAGEGTPDDGTLHLASLLALPDFVTWLLETHDANYEEENFGFMVPLGLACFSKPFPWCKIANEESDWNLRLRETMKILIAKTRKTWRYREKLVLHMALENGPEVTKAMLDALDIRHEADKDKTYLYTDRTGLHYSPCEYVEEFIEVGDKQKKKLLKCLTGQGLT